MKNKKLICLLLILSLLAISGSWSSVAADEFQEQEMIEKVLDDAAALLREMDNEPDAESMAALLGKAKGVAIFPAVIKIGFGIGGLMGDGFLLERDEQGQWYGPTFMDIRGLSYGWQVGIQSIGLVLVITNEQGMDNFRSGNVKLGGDASFAIGPWGRRGELATDPRLESSIYAYSITSGAFLGISVEGSDIRTVPSLNEVYWDAALSSDAMSVQPAEDFRILPLIEALNRITG